MSGIDDVLFELSPQVLLKAYACGIFPMAESADDPGLFWVEPEMRGILPLDNFHIPRSLAKAFKKHPYQFKLDSDFSAVVEACAEQTEGRQSTWINDRIKKLYNELHAMGHANSFELWEGDQLVGGLYGVRLGRAFFGESMFSRKTNTSKFALIYLVYAMKSQGFLLLDTQFSTEHLARFGVVETPRDQYQLLLEDALQDSAYFDPQLGGATSESILQSFSQIS